MSESAAQTPSWPLHPQSLWVERMKADPKENPPCLTPIGQVRHVDEPYVLITGTSWSRAFPANSREVPQNQALQALQLQCQHMAQRYLSCLFDALAWPPEAVFRGREAEVFAAMLRALETGEKALAGGSSHQPGLCLQFAWLNEPSQHGERTHSWQNCSSYWSHRQAAQSGSANFEGKRSSSGGPTSEHCYVLLAGNIHRLQSGAGVASDAGFSPSLGDVGLRIVVHMRCTENGFVQMRIHGVTFSRWWRFAQSPSGGAQSFAQITAGFEETLKKALGGPRAHKIFSYEPSPGEHNLLRIGVVFSFAQVAMQQPPQWRKAFVYVNASGNVVRISYERRPKAAATNRRLLWGSDPVHLSAPEGLRPIAPGSELSPALFRARSTKPKQAPEFSSQASPSAPAASRVGGAPLFSVRVGHWGGLGAKPVRIGSIVKGNVRSDANAAKLAQINTQAFLALFTQWGINVVDYFRFARLPLHVRVRGSISGASGRDLEAAEVEPVLAIKGDTELGLPYLNISYGAAAPHVRWIPPQNTRLAATAKKPHNAEASTPSEPGRAEYLSIAADTRWVCHEMAHVVQFASTGELQLPFAHGIGDALAAIAMDPDSRLAGHPRWRGMTYPWVQIPGRRHDHEPVTGYAWCGARNLARLSFGRHRSQHVHGYFQEQLHSSSMFRLYRSMGGDTGVLPPEGELSPEQMQAWAQRRVAANYCLFLMLRALSLLGPDGVAPAQTADQWVSALIEADLATGEWESPLAVFSAQPSGLGHSDRGQCRGGLLHKIIRWAFERQGLYATDDPNAVQEGLGLPPAVDLYLQDRRGDMRDPGGYSPVPLHLPRLNPSQEECLWMASTPAQSPAPEGKSHWKVPVFSRGSREVPKLGDIQVKAWFSAGLEGDEFDAWKPVNFAQAQAVDGSTVGDAGLSTAAPQGDSRQAIAHVVIDKPKEPAQWLLLAVQAPGDRCLLSHGQAHHHQWAKLATNANALMRQVAFDNNLALIPLSA